MRSIGAKSPVNKSLANHFWLSCVVVGCIKWIMARGECYLNRWEKGETKWNAKRQRKTVKTRRRMIISVEKFERLSHSRQRPALYSCVTQVYKLTLPIPVVNRAHHFPFSSSFPFPVFVNRKKQGKKKGGRPAARSKWIPSFNGLVTVLPAKSPACRFFVLLWLGFKSIAQRRINNSTLYLCIQGFSPMFFFKDFAGDKENLRRKMQWNWLNYYIFFFQWALYKNRIMAFVWPKPESYRTHFCDLAFRKMGVRK